MNIRSISYAAPGLFLLLAAGCGQKGPLYLPGNPSQIQTDVPPQRPADERARNDEDEDERRDEEYRYE